MRKDRRPPTPAPELAESGARAAPARATERDGERSGERSDERDLAKGRTFPCEGCGADLHFHIGEQRLLCPHCGHTKEIDISEGAAVREQDFGATLERAAALREKRRGRADGDADPAREIACDSCGARVQFRGALVSSACAFCGQPVQVDAAAQAEEALPVDGVLPFQVKREKAEVSLHDWVRSRWFAPTAFRRKGIRAKFSGVYLPYWTFDSLTFNTYAGERGEHYYVTVGSGKNRRTQRRTRWYPAAGSFQRFFDDVLVVATRNLSTELLEELEPWPLARCQPYDQRLLAGFLARRYEVDLDEGFQGARLRIDEAVRADVCRRIGGDEQRIHHVHSRFDAVTFKHLLLPVWTLAYRYRDKVHRVVVNAVTGELQGTRPWSVWKILAAVLGGLGLAGGVALAVRAMQ